MRLWLLCQFPVIEVEEIEDSAEHLLERRLVSLATSAEEVVVGLVVHFHVLDHFRTLDVVLGIVPTEYLKRLSVASEMGIEPIAIVI